MQFHGGHSISAGVPSQLMKTSITVLAALGYVAVLSMTLSGQDAGGDGPRYRSGMQLVRPVNYREWNFLSSGIGMTYAAGSAPATAPQFFGNVFVNPSSYRNFLQTGRWPDHAVFIL